MSKNSVVKDLTLTSYDDIFKIKHDNIQSEKVMEIPLTELHSFVNHPFKVLDDKAMMDLVESIKMNGVLHPGIARPRENGGYELIAGHRRKRACELTGLETMKVIIRKSTK